MLKDEDIILTDGVPVFYPYNPKNKQITSNKINEILKKYGIHDSITDIELYEFSDISSFISYLQFL